MARKRTGSTPKDGAAAKDTTEGQPPPYRWKGSQKRKEQEKVGPAVVCEILQSALVKVGQEVGDPPLFLIEPASKIAWVKLPLAISFCIQCRRVRPREVCTDVDCDLCRAPQPSLKPPSETKSKRAATSASTAGPKVS